jgi:hypothetical protein
MVVRGVAVEKVGFSEKSRKSGDSKCSGDSGKSFVELPDAIQFLQILAERVFQQPQDLSTSIRVSAVWHVSRTSQIHWGKMQMRPSGNPAAHWEIRSMLEAMGAQRPAGCNSARFVAFNWPVEGADLYVSASPAISPRCICCHRFGLSASG